MSPSESVSRREYFKRLVAVGGTAALAACLDAQSEAPDGDTVSVPTGDPSERPQRQHAWNAVLDTDDAGNHRLPNHHVLLAFDLAGEPTAEDAATVESAFRSLESAYGYDTNGLLFTVGYGPSYFRTVGAEAPIPEPTALTSIEDPVFDQFDGLIHLASDQPDVVLEAESALFGEIDRPNGVEMAATLAGIVERTEPRRTGFLGSGLPSERADEVGGVPDEMPADTPAFMGFESGFRSSQAPEDRVTIQSGPYAGGTTTHVETLDMQLRAWFTQEDHWLRVAKTFSPGHAEAGSVGETGEKLGSATGAAAAAEETETDAQTEGIVGHAQKAARARDDDGTAPLLRRDFNTTDRDVPGLHFLAHQRSIDEYARVRRAMAGEDIDGVGQRVNNGLLQYIFVARRGNFLVPPRSERALPAVTA
ncbi:Tat pathway signal protein [Halovenus sp. WSH3]|uniref:Tat pathway signal protein n=1 Tax=Halovenus carboxidivorans TaxID=2692199 RepID=A0A6B0T1B0_9EURY|nr:Tat pathway signal protein [Halovenus carboxidivorans]MXR51814.1 Tat pathway signal protein [Halovenus carboxidivorans]